MSRCELLTCRPGLWVDASLPGSWLLCVGGASAQGCEHQARCT